MGIARRAVLSLKIPKKKQKKLPASGTPGPSQCAGWCICCRLQGNHCQLNVTLQPKTSGYSLVEEKETIP